MTLSDNIDTISTALDDIHDAIVAKGVTPSGNITTYATAIENITELNGQTKTVTPTTSNQTVTPDSNYNALTSVTVNAVTSAIDNNITAGNIKKDVSILGVTGTYEGTAASLPANWTFLEEKYNIAGTAQATSYTQINPTFEGEVQDMYDIYRQNFQTTGDANLIFVKHGDGTFTTSLTLLAQDSTGTVDIYNSGNYKIKAWSSPYNWVDTTLRSGYDMSLELDSSVRTINSTGSTVKLIQTDIINVKGDPNPPGSAPPAGVVGNFTLKYEFANPPEELINLYS